MLCLENGDCSEQEIFAWLDEISFSRPKKNINRDFSDGGRVYIYVIF